MSTRRQVMRNRMKQTTKNVGSLTEQYKQAREALIGPIMDLSEAQQMAGFWRNGITNADLDQMYRTGFEAGYKAAAYPTLRTAYCAVILTLREMGSGDEQIRELLEKADEKVNLCIEDDEMQEQLLRDTGLTIDMNAPMSRVQPI